MRYELAIQQARKLWTSGAPSQRLVYELTRQFPEIAPSKIEDDFFDSMGDYPEPDNDMGDTVYG
jgi:hypothetical protein